MPLSTLRQAATEIGGFLQFKFGKTAKAIIIPFRAPHAPQRFARSAGPIQRSAAPGPPQRCRVRPYRLFKDPGNGCPRVQSTPLGASRSRVIIAHHGGSRRLIAASTHRSLVGLSRPALQAFGQAPIFVNKSVISANYAIRLDALEGPPRGRRSSPPVRIGPAWAERRLSRRLRRIGKNPLGGDNFGAPTSACARDWQETPLARAPCEYRIKDWITARDLLYQALARLPSRRSS